MLAVQLNMLVTGLQQDHNRFRESVLKPVTCILTEITSLTMFHDVMLQGDSFTLCAGCIKKGNPDPSNQYAVTVRYFY
jgi:hypothetical protein